MDWLRQGLGWLNKNIAKPALTAVDWLGQNLGPVAADVLSAIPQTAKFGEAMKAGLPVSQRIVGKLKEMSEDADDVFEGRAPRQRAQKAPDLSWDDFNQVRDVIPKLREGAREAKNPLPELKRRAKSRYREFKKSFRAM